MYTNTSNKNAIEEKLLSATYRFSTTVQDENLNVSKLYIREVLVSQLNFRDEATRFQLLCKKYKFDDPQITPLICKTAYIFDVLMIKVAPNGSIIAVENAKELQNKWERLKAELQKDHAGYAFENYLHSVDLTIYDTEKLITFLESDKMYGLFFKGLWLNDDEERMVQYKIQKAENTMELTKKASDKLQSEQYSYRDNILTECSKINNHIQYDILCLGLKNY